MKRELIELTDEMIQAGISSRGSISDKQAKALGLPNGLYGESGWRQRLVGTLITKEAFDLYLSLKDKHLTPAKLAKAQAKAEARAKAKAVAKVETEALVPGRPKKVLAIALDADDYALFERMAAKIGKPMEEVAYRALGVYCEDRKVILQGAPKPPATAPAPAPAEQPEPQPRRSRSERRAAREKAGLAHHGEAWTGEQVTLLCSDFIEGMPLAELTKKHGRTRNAVVARLLRVRDPEIRAMLIAAGEIWERTPG